MFIFKHNWLVVPESRLFRELSRVTEAFQEWLALKAISHDQASQEGRKFSVCSFLLFTVSCLVISVR